MSLLSFDPFQYAERLTKTGLDSETAKEIASAQMEVIRQLMEEKLATKDDLRELKSELKQDLLMLKVELLEKCATKSEMRWLFGIATTILVLAIKFLH